MCELREEWFKDRTFNALIFWNGKKNLKIRVIRNQLRDLLENSVGRKFGQRKKSNIRKVFSKKSYWNSKSFTHWRGEKWNRFEMTWECVWMKEMERWSWNSSSEILNFIPSSIDNTLIKKRCKRRWGWYRMNRYGKLPTAELRVNVERLSNSSGSFAIKWWKESEKVEIFLRKLDVRVLSKTSMFEMLISISVWSTKSEYSSVKPEISCSFVIPVFLQV